MKTINWFCLFFLLGSLLSACEQKVGNIADQSFNKNWLFYKGEIDAQASDFEDQQWRVLNLPHDWAIEGPFDSKHNARTGGLPVTGMGWYRKHFVVPENMEGKQVSIEFDGAMNDAYVWVNGTLVGNRPFGYIGFEFDITEHVKFGAENVIAVRLNPKDLSARWYPGAGIYRNVRIKYNHAIHVPQWGTYITTPVVEQDRAEVEVALKVKNAGATKGSYMVKGIVKDAQGTVVKTFEKQEQVVAAGEVSESTHRFTLDHPVRWDLDHPHLYALTTEIYEGADLVDVYESTFGVRTISFDADKGFFLNEKPVRFNGVCMHHDMGPLGAAINYRAKERQMQIMQRMGVNALRTSHNPPAPELLEICDRLGIVVIVEAFDEWKIGKVENGYNKFFDEWHERDLRDMIKRDRNHPSVIMWSIGNEILEQGRKDGWKVAKMLSDICHDEDNTRPTTAGFNYFPAPFDNQLAMNIDIVGLNYWPLNYKDVKKKYPNMIVYGSETSSQTSSRGIYHLPIEAKEQHETGHVSSYDVIVGPPWAYPPDVEFEQQELNPYSLGEFMWTGFDYIGEPTPYGGRDNSSHGYWNDDWPSKSSYFAPVDLVGFPKDRYYLYQSQWTTKPMVHVLPHWNWEGMEGKKIPVFAYTNAEEVELFVNGKSYGKKVKGVDKTAIPAEFHYFEKGTYMSPYRLSWEVPYFAGAVKVVAYTRGKIVAEKEIKTAGKPAMMELIPDVKTIKANGVDLSYITVNITDKDGTICPNAAHKVTFEVTGAGFNAGVGNGNPRSLTAMKGHSMEAFSGKLMLIVQSKEKAGTIKVVAKSKGLPDAEVNIEVK